MSSPFSDFMEVSGFPQLLSQLGESVTFYANGTGNGTSILAIVTDLDDGGMELQQTHGVDVVRMKGLQVAASQSVTRADQWLISGDKWETVACTDAHDGLKVVTVRRIDQSKQRRARPMGV